MKFVVNLNKNLTLVYNIVEEPITRIWKKVINMLTIDDICKKNHYVFYDPKIISKKIEELYLINQEVNDRLPLENRVLEKISKDNWQDILNKMHINFVVLIKDSNHSDLWEKLTLYNDIIHYLDSRLQNWWDEEKKNKNGDFFRITLDFNKSQKKFFQPIPEDAYKLFSPFPNFGHLYLHYTHIGKGPFNIFIDRDFVLPKDQLVIQHTFTGSVRMIFSDNFLKGDESKNKFIEEWKIFYAARGGKSFWGYDFDDPRLGFGFIKIGDLSEIKIDDKNIDIPDTLEKRQEFRTILATTEVLNWHVE